MKQSKTELILDDLFEYDGEKKWNVQLADRNKVLKSIATIRKYKGNPAVINFFTGVVLQENDLWEIQKMMAKVNRGVA